MLETITMRSNRTTSVSKSRNHFIVHNQICAGSFGKCYQQSIYTKIRYKLGLALDTLQGFICHNTKPTFIYIYTYIYIFVCFEYMQKRRIVARIIFETYPENTIISKIKQFQVQLVIK